MAKNSKIRGRTNVEPSAISEIQVAGFKSISEEQTIEIRPLTILAGANSSGKTSMMQPLLLLKQTLEASYDAGPLQLNGPNVKFTSAEQLLSRTDKRHASDIFQVGMRLSTGEGFQTTFRKEHKVGFRIEQMDISWVGDVSWPDRKTTFWPEMTQAQIVKTGITKGMDPPEKVPEKYKQGQWRIVRDRCFIGPVWVATAPDGTTLSHGARPGAVWEQIIPHVIHLPGLRGNPERTYPLTAVGRTYPGTFQAYTASIISDWWDKDEDNFVALLADLIRLQLTGGVYPERINDAQIELHVGRLPDVPPARKEDRVNIADVGLGVSQTLPVLVALRAARPGTLVYVEQPETHLHPQAQFDLARILAAAAERGVRVVVETHSTMVLLGVQSLVAEGPLDAEIVKLHWFQRDKKGRTTVQSGDLDDEGAFGDWPQDFDDVMLKAQKQYLDAADKRMFAR